MDFVGDYFLKVGSDIPKIDVKNGLEKGATEKVDSVYPYRDTLIIDGGAIPYLDSMGIEALQQVFQDGKRIQVNVMFAEFSGKCCLQDHGDLTNSSRDKPTN